MGHRIPQKVWAQLHEGPAIGAVVGGSLGFLYGLFWGPLIAFFGIFVGIGTGMLMGVLQGLFMVLLAYVVTPERRSALYSGLVLIGNAIIAALPTLLIAPSWWNPNDLENQLLWLYLPNAIAVAASIVFTIRFVLAAFDNTSNDSAVAA